MRKWVGRETYQERFEKGVVHAQNRSQKFGVCKLQCEMKGYTLALEMTTLVSYKVCKATFYVHMSLSNWGLCYMLYMMH